MLRALGIDDVARLVCCPPPSGRARDPHDVAAAARDLGLPEHDIVVAESVPEAVTEALLQTPEEGQIVIAGSLYVVGAARSLLVGR
jgi:folylpolyglutamate synthase/dihydropteroate synthase